MRFVADMQATLAPPVPCRLSVVIVTAVGLPDSSKDCRGVFCQPLGQYQVCAVPLRTRCFAEAWRLVLGDATAPAG